MKIGIYGGTFDPIHYGHLINASFILEEYCLDKIIFIPTKAPVHKTIKHTISADERFYMVEKAIQGNPSFTVSRIEIDRKEPSYTIQTIHQLQQLYPGGDFYLIIGADSYAEFDTWKNFSDIAGLVSILVLRRYGPVEKKISVDRNCREIIFCNNPVIEISSTDIRNRIKNGITPLYLLPDNVITYIQKKGLYQ